MTDRITLTIAPRRRANVRFEEFLSELSAVNAALVEADRILSPVGHQTTYYDIVDLHRRSPPVVELQARPYDRKIDYRATVISGFFGGLQQIQLGYAPDTFHRPMLEKIKAMASSARKRGIVTTIAAGDTAIALDRHFEARVTRILASQEGVFSSVEGWVDGANFHNKTNYCAIYPPAGPRKISARFPEDISDKVRDALKHPIRATGMVYYRFRDTQPYHIDISDIERLEGDSEPFPSLSDLRGIAPEVTGGRPAEEYVREIRDDWT
jgi:hypothetical protein